MVQMHGNVSVPYFYLKERKMSYFVQMKCQISEKLPMKGE